MDTILGQVAQQAVYHLAYPEVWSQNDFASFLSAYYQLPIQKIELSDYHSAIQEASGSTILLRASSFFKTQYPQDLPCLIRENLTF